MRDLNVIRDIVIIAGVVFAIITFTKSCEGANSDAIIIEHHDTIVKIEERVKYKEKTITKIKKENEERIEKYKELSDNARRATCDSIFGLKDSIEESVKIVQLSDTAVVCYYNYEACQAENKLLNENIHDLKNEIIVLKDDNEHLKNKRRLSFITGFASGVVVGFITGAVMPTHTSK